MVSIAGQTTPVVSEYLLGFMICITCLLLQTAASVKQDSTRRQSTITVLATV